MALGRCEMALAEMMSASANSNTAEAMMLVKCILFLFGLFCSIVIVEVVLFSKVVVETGDETKHCLFRRSVGTASDCQKRMKLLGGKRVGTGPRASNEEK